MSHCLERYQRTESRIEVIYRTPAMRNDIPTIAESVEEILQKIGATKSKRSKQRLRALFLIQSGECRTRDSVANALGVHRHTVSRWLTKYEEGGLTELLEIRTRPNRKRVVPDAIYGRLEAELREAPEQFSSYRDVQAWLRDQFDLDVKYKTLYRLIRYEMKVDLAKADASTRVTASRKASVKVTAPEVKTLQDETVQSDSQADNVESSVPSADVETDVNVEADVNLQREAKVDEREYPDFKVKAPTVANFFRSVAFLLEDESVQPSDVIQAVRAANAILNAAPPFGYFEEGGKPYLPTGGRRMQHRRREARRQLRRLQSFANKSGASPEQTRNLLISLADQFDAISHSSIESTDVSITVQASTQRIVTGQQNLATSGDPNSIFLDDVTAEAEFDNQKTAEDIRIDRIGGASQSPEVVQAEYIVLFAEEDDITASIVKRQLGKKDTSVIRAQSSKEVFAALARYPVDLMVINTKLANEDGLELLRKLRDESAFDNIPIVAVGWPEDVEDSDEVLRYGADEYISKPFSPNEFSDVIVKLLIASRTAVQKRDDRAPVKIARIQAGKKKEGGSPASEG
jgi:CheY-like chemotaxis protein/transposase